MTETHIGKAGLEHTREHCRPRWCGEFPPEGHPLAATPEEQRLLAEGKSPVNVYNGAYTRPDAGAGRRKSTYSMPGGLHAGLDDFRAKQEPRVTPVDDLSRFVADRIRDAETEPAIEVMAVYDQPAGPMAHRYAGHVRKDCVVFRRIVALYAEAEANDDGDGFQAGAQRYAEAAMLAIANRWSGHPEFKPEWRLA